MGVVEGHNPEPGAGKMLLIAFAVLIGGALLLQMCNAAIQGTDSPPERTGVRIGDTVRFLEDAALGVTPTAHSALTDAAIAEDRIGWSEVFDSGLAFGVVAGTRGRVIDSSMTRVQVRISNGEHQDRSGWVSREFITKIGGP